MEEVAGRANLGLRGIYEKSGIWAVKISGDDLEPDRGEASSLDLGVWLKVLIGLGMLAIQPEIGG